MSKELRVWLSQELHRRNWSHNEFARQTGFSQTFISYVLKGKRKPSVNFCKKAAQALEVAPDMPMRLAGILPPAEPAKNTDVRIIRVLVEVARELSPKEREYLLYFARLLQEMSWHDDG